MIRDMSVRGKKAAATEVWRLFSEFSMAQFGKKSAMLTEMGLTPGHLKALLVLEPRIPRPMGVCAQALGCDASTATWLIDRLEERDLVERRGSSTDRRVKEVVLTARGEELKAKLQKHYYEPPAALLSLEPQEIDALRSALTKMRAHQAEEAARAQSKQAG
jgi:DNA-binding MarR family transcriptional regulator